MWSLSYVALFVYITVALAGVAGLTFFIAARLFNQKINALQEQVEDLTQASNVVVQDTDDILDSLTTLTGHLAELSISHHKPEALIARVLEDDSWEIDSTYDDVSGQICVYENHTGLPMDNAIEITLDDKDTYTVVMPKRIVTAIRKLLRTREKMQVLTNLESSEREYLLETPVPVKEPVSMGKPGPMPHINPALEAAMAKLKQIPRNEGASND